MIDTLVLHIGTPKTGTTSIQRTLYNNRDVLAENNILYPTASTINMAHHNLYYEFSPGLASKYIKERGGSEAILAEVSASTASNLFLSAEGLRILPQASIKQLMERLNPKKVLLLLYLRRPDLYLHSAFIQHTRLGKYTLTKPKEFINRFQYLSDYYSIYLAWLSVFDALGMDYTFVIRPFSRTLFKCGCVVQDLVEVLINESLLPAKFGDRYEFIVTYKSNQRPTLHELAVRYHLNLLLTQIGLSLSQRLASRLSNRLSELIDIKDDITYSLFSIGDASCIYSFSKKKLNFLLESYVSDDLADHLKSKPHCKEYVGLPADFDLNCGYYNAIAKNLLTESLHLIN